MTNKPTKERENHQRTVEDGAAVDMDMKKKRMTLQSVTRMLDRAGVDYVVGGSGMLLGLGLVDDVRDWDLMTDAPEAEVQAALAGMKWTKDSGTSELYGSSCKLRIEGTEPEVEIIIGFAVRANADFCRMPALMDGIRDGLRVASPEVWMAAYELMGRHEKSALLERYLHESRMAKTMS